MSPSLLLSVVAGDGRLGGSMLGKKLSLLDQEADFDDRERIRKQALEIIQSAKPYASVFFRFSHRDAKNVTLTVTQRKQQVAQVADSILGCRKEYTRRLINDAVDLGIAALRARVSQTYLGFFDIYSPLQVMQQSEAKLASEEAGLAQGQGKTVFGLEEDSGIYLSIEARQNIESMAQGERSYSVTSNARCPSILITKQDLGSMPTISKCLPEYKPVTLEKSSILSDAQIKVLSRHLPSIVRLFNWELIFTPRRDGHSHLTFFVKCADHEYTILLIKDTHGYRFGAFCSEEWRTGGGFCGNGDAFVFTFRDGDELEIVPASGADDQYQCALDGVLIIGGSSSGKGRAAITISDRFR